MTEVVKIGGKTYREVSHRPYRRRFSPKRDSSLIFKSPAQKAYESRKNLEHIRNKRALDNEKEHYRVERKARKEALKQRRREASEARAKKLAELRAKASNAGHKVYNANFSNPFKKKSKHPFGGFESAKRRE